MPHYIRDGMTESKLFLYSKLQHPQSSSCTVTYHPSRKLDEPDMRDTAGEVGTNSKVMYSCGPLHMDEQR